MRGSALAPNHDVAILQSNACIAPGDERDVAVVAGEALERPWQPEAMALGDPACSADVVARTVVLTASGGLPRERSQSVDALLGNVHTVGSPSGPKDVPKALSRSQAVTSQTGSSSISRDYQNVHRKAPVQTTTQHPTGDEN